MIFFLHIESIFYSEPSYQQYWWIIHRFRKKNKSKRPRSLIMHYGSCIMQDNELNLAFQSIKLSPVKVGWLGQDFALFRIGLAEILYFPEHQNLFSADRSDISSRFPPLPFGLFFRRTVSLQMRSCFRQWGLLKLGDVLLLVPESCWCFYTFISNGSRASFTQNCTCPMSERIPVAQRGTAWACTTFAEVSTSSSKGVCMASKAPWTQMHRLLSRKKKEYTNYLHVGC